MHAAVATTIPLRNFSFATVFCAAALRLGASSLHRLGRLWPYQRPSIPLLSLARSARSASITTYTRMPPKKDTASSPSSPRTKRKAADGKTSGASAAVSSPAPKKQKTLDGGFVGDASPNKKKIKAEVADDASANSTAAAPSPPSKDAKKRDSKLPVEEEFGIVDRRFYPAQISAERAREYMTGKRKKPAEELEEALRDTEAARRKVAAGDAVVHWFKLDTRLHDNHGLHLASERARKDGVPLIGIYLVSPQDWEAFATAPVRVDFVLRNLAVLRDDLAALDIPLHVETVPKRARIGPRLLELCAEWGARHLFANVEYEADELRREARLVRHGAAAGVAVDVVHDTCVVPPGRLASGAGNQYSVYSPWYRAWVRHLHEHQVLLDTFPAPGRNPAGTRDKKKVAPLFERNGPDGKDKIPDPDTDEHLASKRLDPELRDRLRSYWPAGEGEARRRLDKFVAERVRDYADKRNLPGDNATALLSPHFAAGTLSARTAVRAARDANTPKGKKPTPLDAGSKGISTWISEVAWRDFYKHVLAHWPYVAMSVPFKPEYAAIAWDYDREKLAAWAEGRTGYPLVDAAVRQMRAMGYMHNRVRMVAASFLCKDLLQDWRCGERLFMSSLIDGDLASNNGGWGFSSSAGVDPQPYFRIFNPILQSEKFDPDGTYIRRWVPELAGVAAPAIHDPYNRGGSGAAAAAKKAGYPRPIVVHKDARDRALKMYKEGLGRNTA